MKVTAMKAEMPVRHWHNLPGSRLITELTRSGARAVTGGPLKIADVRGQPIRLP